MSIFIASLFGFVLQTETTFAHDAPSITPAMLDFDARQAPKLCNDLGAFTLILTNWVPRETLSPEAERKLVVRIRRSPKGAKLGDVVLLDAAGTTLSEEHQTFSPKAECHKVLFELAYSAATLLGAFEKPPPAEPIACPVCPTCLEPTPCPIPPPAPTRVAGDVPIARLQRASTPVRRGFVGAGVFLGSGVSSQGAIGPLLSFGFVPSLHSSRFYVELTGAWAPQDTSKWDVQIIPLSSALCYSRDVFRFCSGLTSTFVERNGLSARDHDLSVGLSATLRMGTELQIVGPLSMRIDAMVSGRFWGRTFGQGLAIPDTSNPFSAALAALGVWSFE